MVRFHHRVPYAHVTPGATNSDKGNGWKMQVRILSWAPYHGGSEMDISSRSSYPSSSLSNFSPHPFEIDGVECASMEGFLQSLKFKDPDVQASVCKLVGLAAKRRGSRKNWQRNQTLYWRSREINRHSQEYQDLLDRAYSALNGNSKFRAALEASGDAVFTHSIGRSNESETVLTTREFVSRLHRLRRENRPE